MSWQSQFKDATTNVAFNLQLSKRMVTAMEIAYYYDQRIQSEFTHSFPHWVASVHAIRNRGLVVHHEKDSNYLSWDFPQRMEYDRNHRYYTFTPAGKAVFNLLVIAGLINLPMLELEEAA